MNLLQIKLVIDENITIFPSKVSCNSSSYFETWSVSWKNIDGLTAGVFSLKPVKLFYSYDDGLSWINLFTGYASENGLIRSYSKITDDSVSLDLIDPANFKGTKKTPSNTIILENYKICDQNNPDISLLHFMANKIGITEFDCGPVDSKVQITSLSDKTFWEEIQQLAECYKVNLHFDRKGRLYFHSEIESDYQKQFKFEFNTEEYPLFNKIDSKYSKASGNVYKTSFDNYEATEDNAIVFRSQENFDESTGFCSIEILPGETYPKEGVLNLNYQDVLTGESYEFVDNLKNPSIGLNSDYDIYFANGNIELISLNGEFGSNPSLTQSLPDAAQIILKNTGTSTAIIKKFELNGKGFKKKSEIKVEQRLPNLDEIDEKIIEIDGKYFSDYETAKSVLSLYLSEGKINSRIFNITTKFIPVIEKGDYAYINIDNEKIPCVINSFSHSQAGSQIHTMRTNIELKELVEFTPSESKIYENPKNKVPVGLPGEKGSDGIASYLHIAWANSADGSIGFSKTDSSNRLYIGTYSDNNIDGSINENSYSWVKIKGDPGNDGINGSYVIYRFGVNTSTTSPPSTWQSNPPTVGLGQYLWMQKATVDSSGTTGSWSNAVRISGDKGEVGPQGPPGTPGYIGMYSNAATLYLKGFDLVGNLTASVGYLYIGNTRYNVNAYSQTLTNNGRGYVIFDETNVKFAKLIANSTSSNWVEYNSTTTVISGTFWVIGTFNKEGLIINNIEVISPISKENYQINYFMDILAKGELEDVNTWANANGINTVVEKIAALEAFVNKLFANQIKLMNNGSLYSDFYNPDGTKNTNSSAERGVYLGADGLAKLWQAILEGVVLTAGSSFISDEFSTQKAGGAETSISKTVLSTDYNLSKSTDFFQEIKSKAAAVGTLDNDWRYTANISGNYKGNSFSSVIYNTLVPKTTDTIDYASISNGILYLGRALIGDAPGDNPFETESDIILTTDICYADYSTWHLEDVPNYVASSTIINDFANNIPNDTPCKFTGVVTISYKSISTKPTNTFSLTDGRVSANSNSLSFFNTNNEFVGNIDINSLIKENTSINITIDGSLPGITTMNITAYEDSAFDIGKSTKMFRNGFIKNLYGSKIFLNSSEFHGIIDSYQSGAEWYVKFSNGFWIRGGFVPRGTSSITVALSPMMSTPNYVVMTTTLNFSSTTYEWSVSSKAINSFKIYRKYSDRDISWVLLGF